MKFLVTLLLTLSFAHASEPSLIGGTLAQPGQFPFVVMINGCTATKIGPREFLTAAHCFFGGPGVFTAPGAISVNATEIPSPGRYVLNVREVRLHPSWLVNCGAHECSGNQTGAKTDDPTKVDLADVRVEEDSPEIPWIGVNFLALARGDEVTFVGYGCTGVIAGPGYGKLRFAANHIGSPDLLKHNRSLYKNVAAAAGESYWVTPGTKLDPKVPSLCPGDSGGPMLTRTASGWEVAGIGSDYTFDGRYERSGAVPMTNLHTRLDDHSHHDVGTWLRLK